MDAGIIFPVVATILLTLLVIHRHRSGVERAYNGFEYFRKLIAAILVVLVAWTFLRSGSQLLFLVALLLIVFATTWFAIEQPHKTVV